jgi:hypothetical protein
MMNAKDEEAAIRRAVTLAEVRRLCNDWGYWCAKSNVRTGYEPFMSTGGVERYYKAPWQWDTPPPRLPEADEIKGLAVQKAYIRLPDRPYRAILRAEFCAKPWLVPLKEGEMEVFLARKAKVSIGAYNVTLERAMLALANVMKRHGLWRLNV